MAYSTMSLIYWMYAWPFQSCFWRLQLTHHEKKAFPCVHWMDYMLGLSFYMSRNLVYIPYQPSYVSMLYLPSVLFLFGRNTEMLVVYLRNSVFLHHLSPYVGHFSVPTPFVILVARTSCAVCHRCHQPATCHIQHADDIALCANSNISWQFIWILPSF